jgi:hypothetical protein
VWTHDYSAICAYPRANRTGSASAEFVEGLTQMRMKTTRKTRRTEVRVRGCIHTVVGAGVTVRTGACCWRRSYRYYYSRSSCAYCSLLAIRSCPQSQLREMICTDCVLAPGVGVSSPEHDVRIVTVSPSTLTKSPPPSYCETTPIGHRHQLRSVCVLKAIPWPRPCPCAASPPACGVNGYYLQQFLFSW